MVKTAEEIENALAPVGQGLCPQADLACKAESTAL